MKAFLEFIGHEGVLFKLVFTLLSKTRSHSTESARVNKEQVAQENPTLQ